MNLFGTIGAQFSPCRTWRYRLWRIWDSSLPLACFVLMNPSTADEIDDDPTVLRCQRRVAKWSHIKIGGVLVVNVFAWRETDSTKLPELIAAGTDIVGPDNDAAIVAAAKEAAIVVCGWGNPGNLTGRGQSVEQLLRGAGLAPHYLKLNNDGTPGHPLYLGYDLMPQLWEKNNG